MVVDVQDTRRPLIGGYTRISRVGGRRGEGFISQEVQQETCAQVAASLGLEIAGWWHDPDHTGGNLQRPEWEALMARVLDPHDPLQGVIVARVDRFARTVPDGAPEVRRIWDSNGGRGIFVAADLPVDTTTPFGRRSLWDWLSGAELNLEVIKAQWWAAKRRALERGAYNARAPFGYRKVPRGAPNPGVLIPDPRTGPVVTRLFERDATGNYTLSDHARWLDREAPKLNRDGRAIAWSPTAVSRILSNRAYLGEARYGDHFPPNPNAHEPLTDPVTFGRCQRPTGQRRAASRGFLLSGLVRCANCRYSMAGWAYGGADGATPVYVCRQRTCTERSTILANRLEGHVLAQVRPWLAGGQLTGVADLDDEIARLDEEIAALREERASFAADLEARRLLGADWLPALRARTDALEAKEAEREQAAERARLAKLVRRHDGELDHADLRDFLLGAIRHVFVRRVPGRRRAPVHDRAMIVWADDPREFRIPSARSPGSPGPVPWHE